MVKQGHRITSFNVPVCLKIKSMRALYQQSLDMLKVGTYIPKGNEELSNVKVSLIIPNSRNQVQLIVV